MKKNIILIGFSRAGKTTASRYISEKYGYHVIEISEFVYSNYKKSQGFRNALEYANYCFETQGYSFFIQKIIDSLNIEEQLIFVGPRSFEEVQLIVDRFKECVLVWINASYSIRKNRSKYDNNASLEERDRVEGTWGLDYLHKKCDYVIDNESTKAHYFREIDSLIESINYSD